MRVVSPCFSYFCIELPDGMKVKKEEKQGDTTRINFEDPNYRFVVVSWNPKRTTADYITGLKTIGGPGKDKQTVAQGDLPGGGYFYHIKFTSGGTIEQL